MKAFRQHPENQSSIAYHKSTIKKSDLNNHLPIKSTF